MNSEDYAQLQSDLETLSRRLDAHVQEMKEGGRFSSAFEGPANDIRARQMQLRSRVTDAIRSGREWAIVKTELMRDYSSLVDSLLQLEQRIDETFSKH